MGPAQCCVCVLERRMACGPCSVLRVYFREKDGMWDLLSVACVFREKDGMWDLLSVACVF